MALSPYKVFNSWLFDGSKKSPLPKATKDVDILKYNSPINHTYVIKMFLKNGPLNHYLNTYFNNINLRYISKEELFIFIKETVINFKINQRDIVYFPYRHKEVLFKKLRDKIPLLKNDDISLFCDIIEKSPEKESIYNTLGLEKLKKVKLKKKKKKQKIKLKDFIEENFSIIKQ